MLCNTWKSFFAKIVDSCPTTCVSFCFAASASLEPRYWAQILFSDTVIKHLFYLCLQTEGKKWYKSHFCTRQINLLTV